MDYRDVFISCLDSHSDGTLRNKLILAVLRVTNVQQCLFFCRADDVFPCQKHRGQHYICRLMPAMEKKRVEYFQLFPCLAHSELVDNH